MPKFFVKNTSSKTVEVAIEPWADGVTLAPDELAEFDFDEPAEVVFALRDEGPLVCVMSDRLEISANGRKQTWEDKSHFLSSQVTGGKQLTFLSLYEASNRFRPD
jgi:hypothetical protein